MIKASDIFGYKRLKWANKQPHKDFDIYWTIKLSRGVGGSDKCYYAVNFKTNRVLRVQELYRKEQAKTVWRVSGTTTSWYDLSDAREHAKDLLL